MGQKLIVVIAGAIAMFALATAATASALKFELTDTPCAEGHNVAICWGILTENHEPHPCVEERGKEFFLCEEVGEQSELLFGGKTVLMITKPFKIEVECEKAESTGTIKQLTPLRELAITAIEGAITYKGCKLGAGTESSVSKKCIIKAEEKSATLKSELLAETELLLKPASGTKFIGVEFKNNGAEKCSTMLVGTHSVTGEQQVEILKPGEVEPSHSGRTVTKSKLKFLEEPAELTEELTLEFVPEPGEPIENYDISKEA